MTKQQVKINNRIKQAFLKRAEKDGIVVYKNHTNRAKPLNHFCGIIKTKHPSDIEELVCGR